ncbi:MAG: response regulator [Anaerolineales bacterium]|nr:response regulator [Anaerolineales bacterium]
MTTKHGYLLVVEDVPDILVLLLETLKFKGYNVVTATNGEEALGVISKGHPSLIITDILMPKMDGFSLVHRLRLNPFTRNIPVVFLSATYIAPEDKEFALTIGVTRFIEKPVDLDEFFPLIEELLTHEKQDSKPLNELDFYEGYKKRLETKLRHKSTQISRDQHLFETLDESQKLAIKASMQTAIRERDEIQKLLDQIRDEIEKMK